MHNIMLAINGLLGMCTGWHIVLSVPSPWGYAALAGGFTLFAIGVIQDYEGVDHG